jgi:hypothetical protein
MSFYWGYNGTHSDRMGYDGIDICILHVLHCTTYITHDIYYMIASNLMFRVVQKLAVPVPPAKHEIKVCPMCWYPIFWGEPVYTTPVTL